MESLMPIDNDINPLARRVNNPEEVVKLEEKIKVVVLDLDRKSVV